MFPAARKGDPISHDSIVPSGVVGPPPTGPSPPCVTGPGMIVSDTDVGGKKVKMIRGAWDRPLQRLAETQFSGDAKIRTDSFDRQLPETK